MKYAKSSQISYVSIMSIIHFQLPVLSYKLNYEIKWRFSFKLLLLP